MCISKVCHQAIQVGYGSCENNLSFMFWVCIGIRLDLFVEFSEVKPLKIMLSSSLLFLFNTNSSFTSLAASSSTKIGFVKHFVVVVGVVVVVDGIISLLILFSRFSDSLSAKQLYLLSSEALLFLFISVLVEKSSLLEPVGIWNDVIWSEQNILSLILILFNIHNTGTICNELSWPKIMIKY